MKNTDVIVTITEQQQVPSPISFGKVLLISTEKANDYTEYKLSLELDKIKVDYGEISEAYKKALAMSKIEGAPDVLAMFGINASDAAFTIDDLNSALETLIQEHNDFFRVITTATEETHKKAIAKWANDNDKFARIQYDNTEFISDYSDVEQRLLLYTKDGYLDVAECAFAATKIPGSFNYKFKNYGKTIAADSLTNTQIADAESKNMGYYINYAGVTMMRSGKTSNGKYIDDLESRVYIKTMMQNKLMQLLVKEDKVSGGQLGLKQIKAAMIEVLEQSTNDNIIMKDENNQGIFNVDTSSAYFENETKRWKNIYFNYKFNDGTDGIDINGIVE